MRHLSYFFLAVFTCLLSAPTVLAEDFGEGTINGSPSKAMQNKAHQYLSWSGIGKLSLPSEGSCSGVLLDTRNAQRQAVGPGYLLTSGHCVLFELGSARINLPIDATVTFNYFYDVPQAHRQYAI